MISLNIVALILNVLACIVVAKSLIANIYAEPTFAVVLLVLNGVCAIYNTFVVVEYLIK